MTTLAAAFDAFARHRSNQVLASWGLAGLAAIGAAADPLAIPALLLGMALWPGMEHLVHRYVLHAPPAPWAWAVALQRRLHYDHHADPKAFEEIFAPTWFNVAAPALLAALYVALLPLPIALALVTGQALAMLAYEWCHMLVHLPYLPRSAAFKRVKDLHAWHHFKNEHYWFGVTNTWVDRLAGTSPDPAAVPRSASVRQLHGD